jgi:endonuclease/exonuclease/phosphatase family metal-dependent hydrolase
VSRRALTLGLLALGACALARTCRGPTAPPPRVATFNIERFGAPDKRTDLGRLAAIIDGLDADVVAVQEIEDPARLHKLAATLRARRYGVALSTCGGRSNMRVGFLYDAERLRPSDVREYPELDPNGEGACSRGERPGLLARFTPSGGRPFALLAVHLAARGDEEHAKKRRSQWRDAIAIARAEHARGVPTAILGDTNSTGWLDDRHGERRFIEARLDEAGMRLVTARLPCSEYYPRDGRLVPSMLDHVAVTRGFPAETATLHGYCRELACREIPAHHAPSDYAAVSDHCPVTVE